jgi:SRSO17 transposase
MAERAGVPDEIGFTTKPQIAAVQPREARLGGAPDGIVLADAGYGNDSVFRDAVSELGLAYAVGIQSSTRVWAPGVAPLPTQPPHGGSGRQPKLLRRAQGHEPASVKNLALALAPSSYRTVLWREGTRATLSSRFEVIRVRPSHRDYWRSMLRDEEWLLVEWPESEPEPVKYWLSKLPNARRWNTWSTSQRCAGASSAVIRTSGPEAGVWSGALRGTGLARLPSPRLAMHCRVRISCRPTSDSGRQ